MERYHFVVSTGQNVANLIPLLELAKPDEPIIILSSSMTETTGLSRRLQKILGDKGYYRTTILPVSDEDVLNYHRLKDSVMKYFSDLSPDEVYFYLNGGQKIAALAINDAFGDVPVRFVYMDGKKTQISIVYDSQTIHRPVQTAIQLKEVLALNESKVGKGQRIYFDGQFDYVSEFSEKILAFAYDEDFAAELLTLIQQLNRKFSLSNHPLKDKAYFNWLKQTSLNYRSEQIEFITREVQNTITRILHSGMRHRAQRDKIVHETRQRIVNKIESLVDWAISLPKNQYDIFLKFIKEPVLLPAATRTLFEKHGLKLPENIKGFPLGKFFEAATTFRFIRFLKENPQSLKSISEIWVNVEFQGQNNPGKASGEYDILILLRNGVLISLECKSFDFEEKDLFARIARLTRRGGLLSELWVGLPLFTTERFQDLLKKQFSVFLNLLGLGIPIIPFTLEGQPATLKIPEIEQEFTIQAFEHALVQNWQKFLPETSF